MALFVGKSVLEPYTQTVALQKPVPAATLPELLKLPKAYHENIIPVRDGKMLSLDELIYDEDEVSVFIAVMGG